MYTSFSTALSALNAHATAIDVVGNNLANLNTPGFKASVASFYDLVTQSAGAGMGETQVGFGVARPLTIRQFSQGAIQTSNGPLDAAIQGDGFLVMRTPAGATVYGRGGNLQVDKNGVLMTATGERVQGWMGANGVVNTTGPIGDITNPTGALRAAKATETFSFDLNLNAAATAGPPADTFSSALEVYDTLGISHIVTVDFTKTANSGEWSYAVSIPDSDVTSPVTPVTGTINFDSSGRLVNPTAAGPFPALAVTGLASGAADMNLTWNLYNGATPRLTQFAQPSAPSANAQDGNPAANFLRVGLGDSGKIFAQYSDGQQVQVGQLAMASVRNPESLLSVGNNSYQVSGRSATPAIGLPGTGGRGTIMGGAIENSTVDIAREFTNLIVLQRGYQANSRVITTVDEISQETINLKR
ncbi:MAG: flagellar hook protein FlgE [Bryobacteraceae bacterium]